MKSISSKIYTVLIVAFLFSILFAINYYTRTKLYDDNLIFQHQHVVNGQVNITILNAESYSQGKSGYFYYIFTDKGRLLVDSKESFFNSSLFHKAQNNINNTCSAIVDSKIISSDWEIHQLDC